MIRRLLPVAVVLVAPVLTHAQATRGDPFHGQLAYRTSDGVLHPLLPDAVYVGWGDGGCELAQQSSERLDFYPDGVFLISDVERTETSTWFNEDGTRSSPAVATVRWACYRFRAEGCHDQVVQFGPEPPKRTIELSCPGREASLRCAAESG